ncbi:MAG: hypothetical protein QOH05_1440 [Acetobacteraceae bacterium]|jgi:hypothetical protein|nr:hypothetical protein [Acetobacteraceae bacterium]
MQACGLQIIQALRDMDLVDPLGDRQFDEDDVSFSPRHGSAFVRTI